MRQHVLPHRTPSRSPKESWGAPHTEVSRAALGYLGIPRGRGRGCNVHAPDREGVERKMQNRQTIHQPCFHAFQMSNNNKIIHQASQNNKPGEAGAFMMVSVTCYVYIFGNLNHVTNLAGAFFAYFACSAPSPPCLGRAHYKARGGAGGRHDAKCETDFSLMQLPGG
jgi:hypothetical protein